MVRKFTRRFDSQAPRNPNAELYDSHVLRPSSWGTAYIVPGGARKSAFHTSLTCEALLRTLELTRRLGHDLDVVPVELRQACQAYAVCPMCSERYVSSPQYRRCLVWLDADWRPGAVLLEWRRAADRVWHGVVVVRRWRGRGSFALAMPEHDLKKLGHALPSR